MDNHLVIVYCCDIYIYIEWGHNIALKIIWNRNGRVMFDERAGFLFIFILSPRTNGRLCASLLWVCSSTRTCIKRGRQSSLFLYFFFIPVEYGIIAMLQGKYNIQCQEEWNWLIHLFASTNWIILHSTVFSWRGCILYLAFAYSHGYKFNCAH